MSDRVFVRGMAFEGRHGVSEEERAEPQVIELDIEVATDLRPAGTRDDLALTIDYAEVFEVCRAQVEQRSYRLLEAIGEAVAADVLRLFPAAAGVTVTVRKPGVPIDGVVEDAGITIERSRVG